MANPFVHLHVHSEYSLLDGLSKLSKLTQRAHELGQPAIALTDHGVMFGAIEFYNAAKKAGVKPIVGIETYLAPRGRADRDPQFDKSPYHLLLLAQDNIGVQNLYKLASIAQLEGFYYKPRVDKEVLAKHSEGLICLSGCGSAEVPELLFKGQTDKARQALAWYRDLFGPERFYVELQWHDGIPGLDQVNTQLIALAQEFGLKTAATNDAHYINADDWNAQDVLLCIGTGSLVSQPDRMRMTDHSYYLKSAEEMAALFGHVPEALDTPLAIAEMCSVDLDPKGYHLPVFPVPEGYTAETFLRKLCEDGLLERYNTRAGEPDVRRRLDYELSVIHQMGFDNYFLIVWDLTRRAKERDIWWNVRGSGAGSMVAYCCGITRLDPLAHGLIFERFLNPDRISMPDIDMDFPDDRRGELIEYTVNKYGKENVAQIIAYGTLGARAAVRDVGRTLDIPLGEVDGVAKLIPAIPGKPVSIAEAIEQVPELKAKYESVDYLAELLDTAQKLEGVTRHASTHAAGVIISDKPLVEYTPLHRPTKGADEESGLGIVTQYEMNTAEAIGLLKIDFLGLSTLTVMRKACDLIQARHGVEFNLENIPTDDAPAFDLLSRGDVAGVFQVEGAGMRRMLIEMRPTRFEHIVAGISLFRPGPIEYIPTYIKRLHGEEKVEYKHPRLEPILSETFGIIVYQEQIIRIASDLAGYSPGDADQIRKAVGKKIKEKIEEHKLKFIKGSVKNGIAQETAEAIYADIEFFARYGFNKGHAADYAVITCQTAYLKAHYPIEYMTALLTVERNNTDKIGFLVSECRRMNIPVLPPDVNKSASDFSIEDGPDKRGGGGVTGIRFGMSAVKNVGEGPVQVILQARQADGEFRSVDEFCRRADLRQVNRRALESLIKVGAFDAFGNRAQLMAIVERMLGLSSHSHRAADLGQMTLFGAGGPAAEASVLAPLPNLDDAPPKEKFSWEKELVGVYVSEHPLMRAMADLSSAVTTMCGQITEDMANQKVAVAGMITYTRRLITKKGDPMAFLGLEDLQGTTEIVVFPRTWKQAEPICHPDKIVLVRGKVDGSGRQPKIIADSITDQFSVLRPADETLASRPAPAVQPQRQREPEPAWEMEADLPPPPPDDWWPEATVPGPAISPPPSAVREPPAAISPTPSASRAALKPVAAPAPSAPPRPNGNTAKNEKQETKSPAQPAKTETPRPLTNGETLPRLLRITLTRTGNEQHDLDLLAQAHQLLTRHAGRDRFVFRITGGGNGPIEMDFPNHSTRYSHELVNALEQTLGPGAVRVEMQP